MSLRDMYFANEILLYKIYNIYENILLSLSRDSTSLCSKSFFR